MFRPFNVWNMERGGRTDRFVRKRCHIQEEVWLSHVAFFKADSALPRKWGLQSPLNAKKVTPMSLRTRCAGWRAAAVTLSVQQCCRWPQNCHFRGVFVEHLKVKVLKDRNRARKETIHPRSLKFLSYPLFPLPHRISGFKDFNPLKSSLSCLSIRTFDSRDVTFKYLCSATADWQVGSVKKCRKSDSVGLNKLRNGWFLFYSPILFVFIHCFQYSLSQKGFVDVEGSLWNHTALSMIRMIFLVLYFGK